MSKRFQIVLLVFFVLAGIRVYLIYRERHAPPPAPAAAPANPNFSADDYVVPTQTHAYDLKSAKEALDNKTVWVKSGNQVYYYPVVGGHPDLKHPTGLLPPLDKLIISNVIQAPTPSGKGQEIAPGVRVHEEQMLAVFHRANDAKTYAAPIGASRGGDYTLYINDTFYLEDPHQLYKHWSPDIWNAIEQHQAKPGMNELQVAMALGVGVPQGNGGEYGNRSLSYDNNGHFVSVTFEHNRAVHVNGAGS